MDIFKAQEMERLLAKNIWTQIDSYNEIRVNKYYLVYGYKTFFDFCKGNLELKLKKIPASDKSLERGLRIIEARIMLEIGYDYNSAALITGLQLNEVMNLKRISEDGGNEKRN